MNGYLEIIQNNHLHVSRYWKTHIILYYCFLALVLTTILDFQSMARWGVATGYGQRNYSSRKMFSDSGGSATWQYCSLFKVSSMAYNKVTQTIHIFLHIFLVTMG